MGADRNDELPTDGESLDALLCEARWPSATQPAVARLTQHWERVWTARQRRETLMRRAAALAVAAMLLGGATIGWLRLRPADKSIAEVEGRSKAAPGRSILQIESNPVGTTSPQSIDTARHETRRPTVTVQTAASGRAKGSSPESESTVNLVPWRPPNELESLMLAASDRNRRHSLAFARGAQPSTKQKVASESFVRSSGKSHRKSSPATDAKSAEAAIVAWAVKRLVSDSGADVASVSAQIRTAAPSHEEFLLATLDRGKAPEQIAALRLLAEIGSAAAVGPTLRAAAVPELHRAAIGTLVQIADSSIVGELVLGEQNADLQRTMLAALLSRGESPALEQFLNFVANEGTADAALAAAQSLKDPPMDLLFSSLSDPLEVRRIAVARVIGRIDGAATTRRLIAMVESGVNRHEACIALLSSRGQEAARYVDTAAEHDPSLAAIFSGARLFSVSDQPPRS
ncbi:MAG TPA: hypothetical protein VGP76_16605 [Planctomycetaceae bacterium]|jgi:hypothetical protein|nr:hypothetical protein [Planctomycetaceae bacterium]